MRCPILKHRLTLRFVPIFFKSYVNQKQYILYRCYNHLKNKTL
jgi:hypothetical protein